MKTEFWYLTLTVLFTGLLWVPYVLDRLAVRGLLDTLGYPQNPRPQSPWAQRLMKAHTNAIENLVIFALLVFVADVTGVPDATISYACILYFWARIVHATVYTFALPWMRTIAFTVGFLCQATLAWSILVSHA